MALSNNWKIVVIILAIIIALIVLYQWGLKRNIESMVDTKIVPLYKNKKFIITPPGEPFNRIISDSFKFKTWDGTNWTAQLVNNVFYLRRMGSNRLNRKRVINILRFRSQEWQVAYLPDQNKFLVFRLAGIRGMPFKVLDLVDWNNHSYTVEVI